MNQVEVKRRRIELFSYIIGIFTIWLLGRQIGDGGMACIAVAVECYVFIWILLGNNVTNALGRILRSKNSKGQYRNISKIKKDVLIFQGMLGLLGSIILFLGAGWLAESVFRMPHCILIFRFFAPVIFLRSFTAVLSGYMQGEGMQFVHAIGCVLRQVFVLGFALLFCGLRREHGARISKLLLQEELIDVYSGAGIAIAIGMAEVLIIMFLSVLYKVSRSARQKQSQEGWKTIDSFGRTIYGLYAQMGSDIVLQLLGMFPLLAGLVFHRRSTSDMLKAAEAYGGFFGKYLMLCLAVVFPLCALILPLTIKAAGCARKEEQRYARNIFQAGMHIGAVNTLLPAALMCFLAQQIAGIFGETAANEVADMLRGGSLAIIFLVLSFYFSNILLLMNKKYVVLGALGLYDILFILSVTLLLRAEKTDIMALVYGGLISGLVYCLATGFFAARQLKCGLRMLVALAVPGVSACITGLLCFLIGKGFTPHLGNGVTLVVCVLLGTVIYWVMLLLLRNFREQELNIIPGGRLIRIVGEMLRVF